MEQEVETNHRTRVGRERREKMRKRILLAMMSCYEEHGADAQPTIDSIIQHAHVSRATFYLHFDSVESARSALLSYFDQDLVAIEIFFEDSDPLDRLATGTLIFLVRCLTDSTWARFISSTNYLITSESYVKVVERHLLTAKKARLVHFKDVATASSLVLGTMLAAMRSLSRPGMRRRHFVEELTVMILCGVGADQERCKEVVQNRIKHLRTCGPGHIPWWKDPWKK